jgi:hypothetical protein
MQAISGAALIVAAVLLLVASRRACRLGDETWLTSDIFVLGVVGPGFIVSLVAGFGTLLYYNLGGENLPAAMIGMALAAVVAGIATLEWLHARGRGEPGARGANVLEFTGKQSALSDSPNEPDAPRPPVSPRARRAA